VELKVSRGYERVVGQLLRYMGWVEQNMETSQPARGIIVAKEISSDLKLASSRIPDIRLIEYEISFKLRPV
jgi:RecB family endonuclease NucS